MVCEVNNGGWNQFFVNSSGALAFDLAPALEAVGSKKNLSIAQRALRIFGKPALAERARSAAALRQGELRGGSRSGEGRHLPLHRLPEPFRLAYVAFNRRAQAFWAMDLDGVKQFPRNAG